MTFDVFRTLSLSYLGEAWKDCYLKFSYLTAEEAKDFASLSVNKENPEDVNRVLDKAIGAIKEKFVEGTAIQNGQTVQVKKEDVDQLPVEVLQKCIQLLVGTIDEGEKKEADGQNISEPSGE